MQQLNSLDKAFTVLTYFLSTKNLNQINSNKSCSGLQGGADGISNMILQANKNQDALNTVSKALSLIENNFRNPVHSEQPQLQPYFCNETRLQLFCEDNRYAKHLILIGRGQNALEPALYQKLSDGVPCDAACIKSNKEFFIGWTNFGNIFSPNLYGVLIVYIYKHQRESFLYISEAKFENKKLIIAKIRSSMSNFDLKQFMENAMTQEMRIKVWKMYLRIKD